MISPNTDNKKLDRCLVWYHLVLEMTKVREQRSHDVWKLGDVSFDMGHVIDGVTIVEGDYCASACCAIGAAALHHWFNEQGLKPAMAERSNYRLDTLNVMVYGKRVSYRYPTVAHFFGLDRDDYRSIVDPEEYGDRQIQPGDVASRMRAIILATYGVDPETHAFIQELAA